MTKYEIFRDAFLTWLKTHFVNDFGFGSTWSIAIKYDIPEPHVRELLVQGADQKLILLASWDGTRIRPMSEWPNQEAFFANTKDGGSFRVRLLAAGGHYVESILTANPPDETAPMTKIGQ